MNNRERGNEMNDGNQNEEIEKFQNNFWLVFRNKFLFSSIFNNFKYKSTQSYSDLIGTYEILNGYSNGIEIIIDKLSSNNHFIENRKHITEIFKTVRNDNERTRLLYKLLFQNYKSNLESNQFNNSHTRKEYLEYIVGSFETFALKQFIEHLSISKQEIINNEIIKKIQFGSSYYGVKMLNYLYSNQYLSDDFQLPKQNISIINLKKIKFGQFIKFYNYFMNIYEKKNNQTKVKEKIKNFVNELKEIKTTDFPKHQLKLKIRQLIKSLNQSSSEENQEYIKSIICKMYKVLYAFGANTKKVTKKPREYYFYLKNKKKVDEWLKNEGHIKKHALLQIYKDLFEIVLKTKEEKLDFISSFLSKSKLTNGGIAIEILETNDIDLIDAFLKLYPDYVNGADKLSILHYTQKTQVLDYLFKEFKEQFFEDNNDYWKHIQSVELLEHYEKLMESCSRICKVDELKNTFNYLPIKPQVLIKVCEKINKSSIFKISSTLYDTIEIQLPNNRINLQYLNTEYIQLSIFSNENNTVQEDCISLLSIFAFKEFHLQLLIPLLRKSHIYKIINWIFRNCSLEFISNHLKENKNNLFGNRLTINYSSENNCKLQESSSKTITFILANNELITYLLFSGLYKIEDIFNLYKEIPELLNDPILSKIKSTPLRSFSSICLEKFIIFLLENFNEKNIDLLYLSIDLAAKRGCLSIFNELISKYSYVLKIKNNSNNSLFDTSSLENIIDGAIRCGYCEVAHLLINHIDFDSNTKQNLTKSNENNNINLLSK